MSLKVDLLERSFDRIKPCAGQFVASFYENLFETNPEIKPMFAHVDMVQQQQKLLSALVLVVENLRNPAALGSVLSALGARHVGYGSLPQQYPAVGKALLLTFEQYLQEDWTPELKQAWTEAYGAITAQMLQGSGSAYPIPDLPRTDSSPVQASPSVAEPLTSIEVIEVAEIEGQETEVEETAPLALSQLSVELLERSFEKIKPQAREFTASFYENLFQAHPEVKPMFAHVDMVQQQQKLLSALVLVVENLRNPAALGSVLGALGARHVGYGSLPQQYPAVGKALLLTFEQYLREDWTPELKRAWTDAYGTITAQMLRGAAKWDSSQSTQAQKSQPSKQGQPSDEQVPVSEVSIPLKNKPKIEFGQQFKAFQEKVAKQPWNTFPKQVLQRFLDEFWAAPVWLVAAIAALAWSGIFLVAEETSWLARVLEGADTTSLILALVLFIKEAPDRRKQFHYQAWSTIDAAHGVNVSYARILALQDLNADGVPLRGLDVPGAEFAGIQLPRADLSHANFSESNLSNANLNQANLNKANLSKTKLSGADLHDANLSFTYLKESNLSSANLNHANLICADLSQVNFSGANLKQANLSGANLTGAYLTGANLKGATISESELRGAFLDGAILPDGSRYRLS